MKSYRNQIYAGVLGKLIGVYLGRPVEGWSYEAIKERFGEVNYYVNEPLDLPLIVADDDISGTFTFYRALEDTLDLTKISSKEFGEAWLNYIIENQTILWWGGLGRSTEHTAYLNLKNGIEAPESGSRKQNGQTLSEQIGAQIFIEAIVMSCPNDPVRAVELTRAAAQVSHDGLAVEAACHLAALQSLAFAENDIETLLDQANKFVKDEKLLEIIAVVRTICHEETDWRIVRERLDERYGYHLYPGACHMVPNHAMVIAAIILGGNDFQRSVMIATSAGWDTDCNAANVGAFNGIRLGLESLTAGVDFRKPIADAMYVVSAAGGSCMTDAVQEANKIYAIAQALQGKEQPPKEAKFSFSYPGATQGFKVWKNQGETLIKISNNNVAHAKDGLLLHCEGLGLGTAVSVATPTFFDYAEESTLYNAIGSPSLYSSQVVTSQLNATADLLVRYFILYYDQDNQIQTKYSEQFMVGEASQTASWKIPDTAGMPIFKLGFELTSQHHFTGELVIRQLDWSGAPTEFSQQGMLMSSIWNTNPHWLKMFVSSADHFSADFSKTYCVSHPGVAGLATVGTNEWADYTVQSTLNYSLHQMGGLVARSNGHRRYYAAGLQNGNEALIYKQHNDLIEVLAVASYPYQADQDYQVVFSVIGDQLALVIDDQLVLQLKDQTFVKGAAGFVISAGTMLANDFIITS